MKVQADLFPNQKSTVALYNRDLFKSHFDYISQIVQLSKDIRSTPFSILSKHLFHLNEDIKKYPIFNLWFLSYRNYFYSYFDSSFPTYEDFLVNLDNETYNKFLFFMAVVYLVSFGADDVPDFAAST